MGERVQIGSRTAHSNPSPLLMPLFWRSLLQASSITQVFDDHGRRIRRIDPDGTVTERIEPNDLFRLWQSKGLLAR